MLICICPLAEIMLCLQADTQRVWNDPVWHLLPVRHIALSACHSVSTTLATPLLFRVRMHFITMCKKCAGLCHDDIGTAFFHWVSSRSVTHMARGQLDLLCSAKGQMKTRCQADSGLFLILFSFVSDSPKLQSHTGARSEKLH